MNGDRTIITGKYIGFCNGVKKAVECAEKIGGKGVYIIGELVHNDDVNKKIQDGGTTFVSDISEVPDGAKLIIRSHGERREVYSECKRRSIEIVDCTCSFVKKIHDIVSKYYSDGYRIVILGKASHPEVIGIADRCDFKAYITEDENDLSFLSEGTRVCVVAQTTFSLEKFNKFLKNIAKINEKTVEIFPTICYTTKERRDDAETLAKKCDAIIVVGGVNSNNTAELVELSKKHCDNVFIITEPKQFDYGKVNKYKMIGLLSGASTPIEQIREVLFRMESTTEVKRSEMDEAMSKLDEKTKKFRKGQILTVTISAATDEGLQVYINNTKKEITLPQEELLTQPYNKADYSEKIGEEIKVMITDLDPVKLSEKSIQKVLEEEALINEIKEGKIFTATCDGFNKGGLSCKFGSYSVFVPSSQIRIGYVKDLEKYVGKQLRLKAEKVESQERRKQIVASQRVILEEERTARDAARKEKEEAFFAAVSVNDVIKGTPVRFAEFGAFIDVCGFDCLAHISDLSWTNIKSPSEVLELNKEYEFIVLAIDQEKKKVSLGYKQLQPKPWDLAAEKYTAGDVVKGKVVRITSFGAFVEIEKGVDGLVHVSQISHEWLENPTSILSVGQEIDVKILNVNPEQERMTLSIKALTPEPEGGATKTRPSKEGEQEEKPRKPRRAPRDKNNGDDDEVREWNEGGEGGASIAELINKQ